MGIYIKGEMPIGNDELRLIIHSNGQVFISHKTYFNETETIPVPPHGDLIDRDALIKDGWLNLYKEVMRMGGYAIHELPLKNPSIAVIIPAEEPTHSNASNTLNALREEGET